MFDYEPGKANRGDIETQKGRWGTPLAAILSGLWAHGNRDGYVKYGGFV